MADDYTSDDLLIDDTLTDISICESESENTPQSINIDISNGSPLDTDDFLVLHYNINSITVDGRLEELKDVTANLNVDVLICTESKLSQYIPTNLIQISGFHEPLRSDRNRHGGGCVMYISDRLTFNQQTELQADTFEHIWTDVRVNDKIYTINTFYRPPNEDSENHDKFIEVSNEILTNLDKYKADTKIIVSDFNFGNCYCKYPILPPKPLDSLAPDIFASFGFTQLIDIPTRVTDTTASLIDLIFVSNTELIKQHGTLPQIADHEGAFVSFNCKPSKSETITKKVYNYKNIDEKGLLNYIKTFDYENTVFKKPLEEQTEAFTNILSQGIAQFAPIKKLLSENMTSPG